VLLLFNPVLNFIFSLLPITSISHSYASISESTFDYWRYKNIWLTLTLTFYIVSYTYVHCTAEFSSKMATVPTLRKSASSYLHRKIHLRHVTTNRIVIFFFFFFVINHLLEAVFENVFYIPFKPVKRRLTLCNVVFFSLCYITFQHWCWSIFYGLARSM